MDGIEVGQEFTFTSPYEYAGDIPTETLIGRKAVVVRALDPETYDSDEVGDMYVIRFTDDGTEVEVWPEEINPSLMDGWTPDV